MLTYKEKFNSERRWDRKIAVVSLFHNRMLLKYGKKWKKKNTAKYFCKSLALICEDLKIAKALHEGLDFNSRADALRKIKINVR